MAKSIRELPLTEQLYIEQGFFSVLANDVSTKNPDSLRSECDAEIVDQYYATGAKGYDAMLNGQKVGTYSVRMGGGKRSSTTKKLVIRDMHELERFIENNNVASVGDDDSSYAELYAQAMAQNFAEFVLETFGELPDGCEVVEEVTPEVEPHVLGTTLRIDAEKVAAALVGYLPTPLAGLIGGEDEE